jgi:hypothetical protein
MGLSNSLYSGRTIRQGRIEQATSPISASVRSLLSSACKSCMGLLALSQKYHMLGCKHCKLRAMEPECPEVLKARSVPTMPSATPSCK